MPNVVIIGAGNAGLCAALAAAEQGARVTVLERAPLEERGGNSAFTAGAIRVTYDGPSDLRRLMPDLTEAEWQNSDFGTYPAESYYDDMARVTEFRCDPDLTEVLVSRSLPTLEWMRTKAIRFSPTYHRPGVQGRRPVPVLGRADRRGGGRRPRAGGHPVGQRRAGRGHLPVPGPRRLAHAAARSTASGCAPGTGTPR